jgi:hypothetical protein
MQDRGIHTMACSLGGTTFDHTPLWIDRNRRPILIADVSTAIDGSEIMTISARRKQFPITLEATAETGWLQGSTVKSIETLSAVKGAYYTLTLNGENRTVRFRNEQEGGAIQMETLVPHSNPDDGTWYIGRIYLMCVSDELLCQWSL